MKYEKQARDLTVQEVYDYVRKLQASNSELVTEMQRKTGDASASWEDTVLSQMNSNQVLELLHRNYRRQLKRISEFTAQTVTVLVAVKIDDNGTTTVIPPTEEEV